MTLQDCPLPQDNLTPFKIGGVSQSQLSVSRHYGGCEFNGAHYTYNPKTDELVRDDVLKWAKRNKVNINDL